MPLYRIPSSHSALGELLPPIEQADIISSFTASPSEGDPPYVLGVWIRDPSDETGTRILPRYLTQEQVDMLLPLRPAG
jgi:hypothetical protein